MAGEVESSKLAKKCLSFWTIYIFVFSLVIILSGCVSRPSGTFADNVSSEQKKVELKRRLEKVKYDDPTTHFLLAQLYHADRAWDDAEFYYNNALTYGPVYMPAQAGIVKLFIDRGDKLKAQHYFENYSNLAGKKPSALVELGREFQQQGLDTYALECFQKAFDLAPKSAEVHKYLGYYYLSKNDKDKARECFENSFNLDRNQHDVSRELGKLGVPVVYEGKPPKTEQAEK
ncbi:MAG: hypothetical protein JW787_11785 [Sedimentisphaerales bacterium]|nr:hypothetical protein [Sedimentisphaerales bacterium]